MKRIHLVHDWLNQYGGAERVLEQLVHLFPNAPVYTSMYWADGMPEMYRTWPIHTTWMDRLPGIYHHHQYYFPLYALAFAQMRFKPSACELIISNKSGFCHAAHADGVPHLCYCLAPTRYVWQFENYAARENLPYWTRILLKPVISILRRWDYRVAQRSTITYVAISREIQSRIRKYYQRESTIIYPAVDIGRYRPDKSHGSYYLVVSRLAPYKRVDIAVRAFTHLNLPLVVVGEGRDRPALESIAGPSVSFLGRVPDEQLPGLFAGCEALIFPGEEDFGMTPVEAQASGRPVIAYGGGGALDTVLDGVTGQFFNSLSADALEDAVRRFHPDDIDPQACRTNAERFSVHVFARELMSLVNQLLS